MNASSNDGTEQDSKSTLYILPMMTATGKALDTVGNAGDGEGVEACLSTKQVRIKNDNQTTATIK